MLRESEKLDSLNRLVIELSRVKDLDILMEHILTNARRVVNADAGSIYIANGKRLNFSYTQNETLQKRLKPGEKLIYSTFSLPINKKSIAGYVASTGSPLNIENVYRIDPTSPYQFSKEFDEASVYRTQSALTIPLISANDSTMGVLQIINACDSDNRVVPFSKEDERIMTHFASIASVALEKAQMTRDIILRMIRMAKLRDPKETAGHVNRVGAFSVELYDRWASQNNIPKKEIENNRDILRMAAMLHDVGKVGISDLILKKPGRFEKDEFAVMKQHTILGARLFSGHKSELDEAASLVALTHHEHWDGSGYPGHVDIQTGLPLKDHTAPDGKPLGKKGKEIPIFGRIVAIADVYDALSSSRSYKDAWDESEVLKEIRKESGGYFDPELVEVFLSAYEVIRSIRNRYPGPDSN